MVLVVVVFRVSWDAIYSFRITQLARKGSSAEIYARFSRSNDSLPSYSAHQSLFLEKEHRGGCSVCSDRLEYIGWETPQMAGRRDILQGIEEPGLLDRLMEGWQLFMAQT